MTAHPYWPLKPSSFIEYIFLKITGSVAPDLSVGVNEPRIPTKTPWTSNEYLRMTCIPSDIHSMIPHTMRVDTERGEVPDPSRPWKGALYNAEWNCQMPYIGEIGAENFICVPPPPLLTVVPITGETFDIDVTWHDSKAKLWEQYLCRYKTLHVGQPWGQWPDTVRTALVERPGTADALHYNKIFARDVGEVDSWVVDAQGNGFQFYGVGHG